MRRGRERRSGERSKTQAAQIEDAKVKTKFLPFEEARKFVHGLKLKNVREYEKWCISLILFPILKNASVMLLITYPISLILRIKFLIILLSL